MPNSTAAISEASQVSTKVSSRAARPIRMPETVTIILRLPIRSETIPPMIAVSTTQTV